jgi:hypothetical protein
MKLTRIIPLLIIPALLAACYNHKREALNPPISSCSTVGTTYSGFIRPLVQNTCLTCHGASVAASSGNGVVLEGHSNLQARALNGQLMNSINHAPGAPAMPDGGPKLDPCTIARFQAWVDAGAPNN